MRSVADAAGQFSISLPGGWFVNPLDAAALAREVPAAVRPRMDGGTSGLIAFGPGGSGRAPMLLVAAVPLAPSNAQGDPLQVVSAVLAAPLPADALRVLREGSATVAGLPAYYIYSLVDAPDRSATLYSVMVFMTVGQTAFYAFGATQTDPIRIERDLATISAILETFRPTAPQVRRPPPSEPVPANEAGGGPTGGVFMVFAVPRAPHGVFDAAGGTAFFISPDGTALTNSHVVYEAYVNPAYELVALVNGEFYGASVVCASVLTHDPWSDPSTSVAPSRDVAEIRITDAPEFPFQSLHATSGAPYGYAHHGPLPAFPTLRLGPDPVVGEPVHFIGYGSSLGSVPYPASTGGTVRKIEKAADGTPIFSVVLDGNAMHGDSGSPVLDSDGDVVGLLAWASQPNLHLGYAMTRSALDPVCR